MTQQNGYQLKLPYLCVVVVGSAILLLDILSSGCEKGQRVEVLMGGLLPTCHQLPIIKQL